MIKAELNNGEARIEVQGNKITVQYEACKIVEMILNDICKSKSDLYAMLMTASDYFKLKGREAEKEVLGKDPEEAFKEMIDTLIKDIK